MPVKNHKCAIYLFEQTVLELKRGEKEHFYVGEISCHSLGLWKAAGPLQLIYFSPKRNT